MNDVEKVMGYNSSLIILCVEVANGRYLVQQLSSLSVRSSNINR